MLTPTATNPAPILTLLVTELAVITDDSVARISMSSSAVTALPRRLPLSRMIASVSLVTVLRVTAPTAPTTALTAPAPAVSPTLIA